MKKNLIISLFIISIFSNSASALDMNGINMVNPLEGNPYTYQEVVNQPSLELKRVSLTRNAIKNQYSIAMDKFMQSNVRSVSYTHLTLPTN